MQIPNRFRTRLSGKVRGRYQFLTGKVVMQVDVIEERSCAPMEIPPPPGCADIETWVKNDRKRMENSWVFSRRYWRDANPDDAFSVFEFNAELTNHRPVSVDYILNRGIYE